MAIEGCSLTKVQQVSDPDGLEGKVAIPVHGFATAERGITAGDGAMPVYVVSEAQIQSGEFSLMGGSSLPVIDAAVLNPGEAALSGGRAMPVYLTGGTLGGASPPAAPTYAEILADDYGVSEVWPLVDIASGTAINAFVDTDRNGILTGWDLQNAAGPVAGTLAPYSDGVNDFGNVLSTALISAFNGSVFSGILFTQALNWAVSGTMLKLQVDGNNYIVISNIATNRLLLRYVAGGNIKQYLQINDSNLWRMYSWSVDSGADSCEFFVNGLSVASFSGLGAFSSSDLTLAIVGAETLGPSAIFNGNMAYLGLKFGAALTPTEHAGIWAVRLTGGPD